jgi:lambda repressor-like predicted transcriptional regulator
VILLKWSKKWAVVACIAVVFAAVVIVAGIAGGVLYGATAASAQEPEPTACPLCDDGRLHMFGWGGGSWAQFDAAAEALGLTPNELFTELHDNGKTVAEIAEEQGVDIETVKDALSASRAEAQREAIEQAVEDGRMSQEQADWLLEGLEKGFHPGGRGMGFGRGHLFGGGRGFGRGGW